MTWWLLWSYQKRIIVLWTRETRGTHAPRSTPRDLSSVPISSTNLWYDLPLISSLHNPLLQTRCLFVYFCFQTKSLGHRLRLRQAGCPAVHYSTSWLYGCVASMAIINKAESTVCCKHFWWQRTKYTFIISNENRHLEVLRITQAPMSGHARYFSNIFSGLCLLISRWEQHLVAGAPMLPNIHSTWFGTEMGFLANIMLKQKYPLKSWFRAGTLLCNNSPENTIIFLLGETLASERWRVTTATCEAHKPAGKWLSIKWFKT